MRYKIVFSVEREGTEIKIEEAPDHGYWRARRRSWVKDDVGYERRLRDALEDAKREVDSLRDEEAQKQCVMSNARRIVKEVLGQE
jgi:hypothetical protein